MYLRLSHVFNCFTHPTVTGMSHFFLLLTPLGKKASTKDTQQLKKKTSTNTHLRFGYRRIKKNQFTSSVPALQDAATGRSASSPCSPHATMGASSPCGGGKEGLLPLSHRWCSSLSSYMVLLPLTPRVAGLIHAPLTRSTSRRLDPA
jgi:hypothetical protein